MLDWRKRNVSPELYKQIVNDAGCAFLTVIAAVFSAGVQRILVWFFSVQVRLNFSLFLVSVDLSMLFVGGYFQGRVNCSLILIYSKFLISF